ncbi:MAG: hypothetical protein LBU09_03280 [Endomicrobium sp.]|jgi:hypothetical protein|nr:hypothetical protein [Endomicrobium sp.]
MNEIKNVVYSIFALLIIICASFWAGCLYADRRTVSKLDQRQQRYNQLLQQYEITIESYTARIDELENGQRRSLEFISKAETNIEREIDIIGDRANKIFKLLEQVRKQKQNL